jgi:hypothetical protein
MSHHRASRDAHLAREVARRTSQPLAVHADGSTLLLTQAQWARSVVQQSPHSMSARGVMVVAGATPAEGLAPLQLTNPAAAVPSIAERLGACALSHPTHPTHTEHARERGEHCETHYALTTHRTYPNIAHPNARNALRFAIL